MCDKTFLQHQVNKRAKELEWSQADVASAIGISPASLSLKLAKKQKFSLEEGRDLAKFLGISLDLFVELYTYEA